MKIIFLVLSVLLVACAGKEIISLTAGVGPTYGNSSSSTTNNTSSSTTTSCDHDGDSCKTPVTSSSSNSSSSSSSSSTSNKIGGIMYQHTFDVVVPGILYQTNGTCSVILGVKF